MNTTTTNNNNNNINDDDGDYDTNDGPSNFPLKKIIYIYFYPFSFIIPV